MASAIENYRSSPSSRSRSRFRMHHMIFVSLSTKPRPPHFPRRLAVENEGIFILKLL